MANVGGPILFGYCLDIFLYGILTVQTYLYYLAFPQDRRRTKSIVYFVYIVGTLQTALALHDFYILFCTPQGNRYLESSTFDIHRFSFMWFTIAVGDALIASVVQLFYAHRTYVISKARIFTAIVSILAFLQFLGGIMSAVCVFGPRFEKYGFAGSIGLPIGAAIGAVCDLLIAIFMSRCLAAQMKGTPRITQVLVTGVGRLLLETGILTAGMAVAYAILPFFTSYGIMVPGLSLGKLYANSMLVVLNNRFTIPGGRNVPHSDFDIPSYRRSDLAGVNTGPVLSRSIAFARGRPEGTALSGGDIQTIGLNPRRGRITQGSEGVGAKKAEAGHV